MLFWGQAASSKLRLRNSPLQHSPATIAGCQELIQSQKPELLELDAKPEPPELSVHFCPFKGECLADFLFIHGFFTGSWRSKKALLVHSRIHLAITGNCFTHSLHSHEYLHSITRLWATKRRIRFSGTETGTGSAPIS